MISRHSSLRESTRNGETDSWQPYSSPRTSIDPRASNELVRVPTVWDSIILILMQHRLVLRLLRLSLILTRRSIEVPLSQSHLSVKCSFRNHDQSLAPFRKLFSQERREWPETPDRAERKNQIKSAVAPMGKCEKKAISEAETQGRQNGMWERAHHILARYVRGWARVGIGIYALPRRSK